MACFDGQNQPILAFATTATGAACVVHFVANKPGGLLHHTIHLFSVLQGGSDLTVVFCSLTVQVAEQRREQLLAANKHILEQDSYTRSAASSTAAGTAPAASSASGTNGSADGGSGNRTSDPGIPATNSTASMSTVTDGVGGSSQQAIEHLALLTRVKACSDARKCSPADLLLPELGVTSPENKLAQAVVYKRMMWELTTQ